MKRILEYNEFQNNIANIIKKLNEGVEESFLELFDNFPMTRIVSKGVSHKSLENINVVRGKGRSITPGFEVICTIPISDRVDNIINAHQKMGEYVKEIQHSMSILTSMYGWRLIAMKIATEIDEHYIEITHQFEHNPIKVKEDITKVTTTRDVEDYFHDINYNDFDIKVLTGELAGYKIIIYDYEEKTEDDIDFEDMMDVLNMSDYDFSTNSYDEIVEIELYY